MNEAELLREYWRPFVAFSPHVTVRRQQSLLADAQLKPLHAPLAFCSNGCRDPTSIEPWERLRKYRSLRAANWQSRAYNMDIPRPSIPNELLETLLQESTSRRVILSRQNVLGCRVATVRTTWGQVIIAASGARGHLLAVTSKPDDGAMQHHTVLHACMECPVFDIQPERDFSLCTSVPGEQASSSQHDPAPVATTQLAVRHAMGISVLTLSIPSQVSNSRLHVKVDVSPTLFIPAAMQVVAIHWNPMISGELVYACGDMSLHSLQLPTQQSVWPQCAQHGCGVEAGIPQPRLVVRSLSGNHELLPEHPVALAFLAHPRRVYLANDSSIYFADIPYSSVTAQKQSRWKKLITSDHAFGNITCLQAAPWRAPRPSTSMPVAPDDSHKFSYAPLREHLRHILFVSCSRRLLAYDVRNAGRPALSSVTPRSAGDAGHLHVELGECFIPFPAEPANTQAPTDSDAPASEDAGAGDRRNKSSRRKRQRAAPGAQKSGGCDQAAGSQETARGAPRCAGQPHAVVALGHVTAACRVSGQLFTVAVALAPPLRGLLVRENKKGGAIKRARGNAGRADSRSDTGETNLEGTEGPPGDKGDVEALLKDLVAGEPEPPMRIDPVLLPTLRVEEGRAPGQVVGGGSGGLNVPWSFSLAAAAVCFGPVRVFGFPLRAHLNADAMALPDFAAAEIAREAAATGDGDGHADMDESATEDDGSADEEDAAGDRPDGGDGEEGSMSQGSEYAPEDMIAMLEGGMDSLGAVFEWRRSAGSCGGASAGCAGPEGCAGGDEGAMSVHDLTEDDLVAGARLLEKDWAAGDGARAFRQLMRALPILHVVRGLITGSAVVQAFGWGQWEVGEWPVPQRLEVRLWRPGMHVDKGQMRRAVQVAGVPSRREPVVRPKRIHVAVENLLEVAEDLQSWKLECTTCTDQLEGWWGLWSSEPLSIANAVQWLGAGDRQPAGARQPKHSGSSSQEGVDEVAAVVHCWPFGAVDTDDTDGAAPAVVAAALSGLLRHVRGALSLTDLWAAVLMLHARVTGGEELEEEERELAARPRTYRGWRLNAGRMHSLVDLEADLPEHACGRVCPQEHGGMSMYYLEEPEESSDEEEEDEGRTALISEAEARERIAALLEEGADEYLLGGEVPKPLPGRVVGAAARVHAGINRNHAVVRQREKADVLMQFGLRRAWGDECEGGIGGAAVLAWVVHELRGMGEGCHLQLHCMSHPWWLDEATLTPGGHVRRRMVIRDCEGAPRHGDEGGASAGENSGGSGGGSRTALGCDLSQWVLLPAGGRSQKRRVSVKSRHQLQMGPGEVEVEDEEVGERLKALLSSW